MWTTTSVDSLLSKNKASDTTKQCTIYANSEKWSSLAATLTDAETAVKPKKRFGVYREGSRKAWLVANNEKRGFAIAPWSVGRDDPMTPFAHADGAMGSSRPTAGGAMVGRHDPMPPFTHAGGAMGSSRPTDDERCMGMPRHVEVLV